MTKRSYAWHKATVGLVLIALAGLVYATQSGDQPVERKADRVTSGPPECGIDAQVRRADLIFEGVVRAVDYRMSHAVAENEVSLPLTFVTFEIQRLFKGLLPQQRPGFLTLRFLGGPDPSGKVMRTSLGSYFEVGRREILFVRRNHRGAGSLVHDGHRRFRVFDEEVFTENGREVLLQPSGEIVAGTLSDRRELHEYSIGDQRFYRQYGGDSLQTGMGSTGVRLGLEEFRLFLSEVAARLTPPGTECYVDDVDPDAPFSIGAVRAVAPPQTKERYSDMPSAERVERANEQRVLEQR